MTASRIILLLTMLLLLLMPLMEHLWSWDGFLRGGPDFELGLLGMLLFCGLVVLVAQQVITSPFLSLLLTHQLRKPPLRSLWTLLLRVDMGLPVELPLTGRCSALFLAEGSMAMRV